VLTYAIVGGLILIVGVMVLADVLFVRILRTTPSEEQYEVTNPLYEEDEEELW
jgi:hypothetical protein